MAWHAFDSIRFGLTSLQQRQRPQGQAPGDAAPWPRPRAPPPCRPTAAVATGPARRRSVLSTCCAGLPTRRHAALPCGCLVCTGRVSAEATCSQSQSPRAKSEISDFHGRWASLIGGSQRMRHRHRRHRPNAPISTQPRSTPGRLGSATNDAGPWGSGRLTPGWAVERELVGCGFHRP